MFKFWWQPWYKKKSMEFLETRYARKPFALAFIIGATLFAVISVTRVVIGRPLDWLMLIFAAIMLVAGCVWFRIAYCSQEELKRRLNAEGVEEQVDGQ